MSIGDNVGITRCWIFMLLLGRASRKHKNSTTRDPNVIPNRHPILDSLYPVLQAGYGLIMQLIPTCASFICPLQCTWCIHALSHYKPGDYGTAVRYTPSSSLGILEAIYLICDAFTHMHDKEDMSSWNSLWSKRVNMLDWTIPNINFLLHPWPLHCMIIDQLIIFLTLGIKIGLVWKSIRQIITLTCISQFTATLQLPRHTLPWPRNNATRSFFFLQSTSASSCLSANNVAFCHSIVLLWMW